MTTPFPYGRGPLTPEEMTANREASSIALDRLKQAPADPMNTRSAILNLMGAWSDGIMARPEIIGLLDQHEANLRRAWEHAELGHAQQRAEDAIRGAVRAAMAGRLL